jgi:four helix bundle protein
LIKEKGKRIAGFRELNVYRNAMGSAMEMCELSKSFPQEERFSLVDQMRRSSRSVCANLAEGWRKRRYKPAFIAKLSDAESEACETQVWLEFAEKCGYLGKEKFLKIDDQYEHIISQIVLMIDNADKWIIEKSKN